MSLHQDQSICQCFARIGENSMHEVVAMRFSMCMVCLSCNSVFGVDYPVRVCLEECFFFCCHYRAGHFCFGATFAVF